MQAQNRSLKRFWCEMAPKLGQNVKKITPAQVKKRAPLFSQVLELCFQQRNLTEAVFYSGFKRILLTPGVTPAEVKNGLLNRPGHAVSLLRDFFFGPLPAKAARLGLGFGGLGGKSHQN